MNFWKENSLSMTRRHFFGRGAKGIGSLALGSLLQKDLFSDPSKKTFGALNALHFAPKAKRVIYLFMSGAPSQLDLFDPKPKLVQMMANQCQKALLKDNELLNLQEKN